MSTLLTAVEYASDSYMGSTGTVPANAVQVAIDIAEGQVSKALGYPVDDTDGTPTFITTSFTEEHPTQWPPREHRLLKPRVQSITSVTALHALGCNCEWTEITECAFLYDARHGVVQWEACTALNRCYRSCRCPKRIRYVYVAGFTAAQVAATTPAGQAIRLAIALQARANMNLLSHDTDGGVAVKSYSSLGYSETRDFVRSASGRSMGLGILSQAAADVLRPYVVRSPVFIRSK